MTIKLAPRKPDLKCPRCGANKWFYVEAKTTLSLERMYPGLPGPPSRLVANKKFAAPEWDDDSACQCVQCEHTAEAAFFASCAHEYAVSPTNPKNKGQRP